MERELISHGFNTSTNGGVVPFSNLTHIGIIYEQRRLAFDPWTGNSLKTVLEERIFPVLKVIRLLCDETVVAPSQGL